MSVKSVGPGSPCTFREQSSSGFVEAVADHVIGQTNAPLSPPPTDRSTATTGGPRSGKRGPDRVGRSETRPGEPVRCGQCARRSRHRPVRPEHRHLIPRRRWRASRPTGRSTHGRRHLAQREQNAPPARRRDEDAEASSRDSVACSDDAGNDSSCGTAVTCDDGTEWAENSVSRTSLVPNRRNMARITVIRKEKS